MGSASQALALIVGYFWAVNGAAFLMFWMDKSAAREGRRRVPEATLLGLALVGGSAGAKIAQRRFRHKTRKQPFRALLNGIVLLHLGGIAVLLWKSAWPHFV